MSAAWQPAHALLLAHARVGDLVDAALCSGGSDRPLVVVAAMVVDDGIAVIARIGPQGYPPADCYALERLMPIVRTRNVALAKATRLKVAVAVYATLGSNQADIDLVHRTGWPGTRMEGRYIQCWITRCRDHDADRLMTALAEAVDHARAEDGGLVLPDLAPKPITYPWADAADG